MNKTSAISITILIAIVVFFAIITYCAATYHQDTVHRYGNGTAIGLNCSVDAPLIPYINLTSTSWSGIGGIEVVNGSLTLIASEANDSNQFFENLRVVMYTRVESNSTNGGPTVIKVHVIATQNESIVPSDAIDSTQVEIPKFGKDMPSYNFSLGCSVVAGQKAPDPLPTIDYKG